jgi:hypothetical protein
MDSGVLPRPGFHPHTSSPDGGFHTGWSFPSLPSTVVLMPSERLIRAVLATIDSWIDALDEIYASAVPINRARVLHLKCQMLMSKVSFIRLVNGTQEEIDTAMAQANKFAAPTIDDK